MTLIKPEKRLALLLHLLAWIIILLLPRYLSSLWGNEDMRFFRHYYLNVGFYGIFFYLNYLLLVPRLYFKGKRPLYFGSLVLIIAATIFLMVQLNDVLFPRPGRRGEDRPQTEKVQEHANETSRAGQAQAEPAPGDPASNGRESGDRESGDGTARSSDDGERNSDRRRPPPFKLFGAINYLSTLLLLSGFSLGLGMMDRFRRNEQERKELEKEMLNAELALLKNQVSPHFFFNTLNNIYSLIQFDTEKAGETVHKLSKLMRYLLYDSDKELALLDDEIRFMRHYIELMQLRLNEKVELKIDMPEHTQELRIPPLLFIPVIENAFKHGISYREESFIEVALETDGKQLHFRTRNSLHRKNGHDPEGHSGIGLENVRKRLGLLFPGDRHTFTAQDQGDSFEVRITVDTNALPS